MTRLARSVALVRPELDSYPLPPGVHPLTVPLDAVMRCLTFRMKDLPEALGLSMSSVERLLRLGLLPKPDLVLGKKRKTRFWLRETIVQWLERRCRV
jgi:predicted DNA-binding transcriptional regulator AlpA